MMNTIDKMTGEGAGQDDASAAALPSGARGSSDAASAAETAEASAGEASANAAVTASLSGESSEQARNVDAVGAAAAHDAAPQAWNEAGQLPVDEVSPAAVLEWSEADEVLPGESVLVPSEAAQEIGLMFRREAADEGEAPDTGALPGMAAGAGSPDGGLAGADTGASPAAEGDAATQGAEAGGARPVEAAAGDGHSAVEQPRLVDPAEAGESVSEAREAYWARVLTGDLHEVPEVVLERSGSDDAGLDEEERSYRLASVINRSWVADHSALTREQVRERWGRLRSVLASQLRVADDEQEVFRAISLRSSEEELRSKARALYDEAFMAGLAGDLDYADTQQMEGMDEVVARGMRQVALQAVMEGGRKRDELLPLAQKVASGFRAVYATENKLLSAPDVLMAVPDVLGSLDELGGLPEADRRIVYHLAKELAPQLPEDESTFRKAIRSFRRSALGLSLDSMQMVGNLTASVMSSLGDQLDERIGTDLRGTSATVDRRLRTVEELLRAAKDDAYSLELGEGASRAEQYLVDAAGATPGAIAAFCGGAGFAGLTLSGVGRAIADARQRAPEGDLKLQTAAGIIGGTIQAGIYMGMGKLGGKALEQTIGAFARAQGGGAGGYSLAALKGLAGLTGESAALLLGGKAAQATELGMQELAARVDQTASHIDWKAYGDNLTDLEVNMRESAMLLPFLLIGSGRVALRHFRSPSMVLGDGSYLADWGISKERIDAMMHERNPDRQGTMLRDALRGSTRWGGAGFMDEAVRAMRLLNTDYFQGFSQPEVVRDFLRLPSESASLRKTQEPMKAGDAEAMERVLQRPGAQVEGRRFRLAQVLPVWDEWWAKSHLLGMGDASARHLRTQLMRNSWEHRVRYAQDMENLDRLVPEYRDAVGAQRRLAEHERRLMVQDRFAELQDLSYQHLLNIYSLDGLMKNNSSPERLHSRTERTRQAFLGDAAKLLLNMAAEGGREGALRQFERDWGAAFLRRRNRALAPAWMTRVPSQMLSHMDAYVGKAHTVGLDDAPPELLQSIRVMQGVESCASMLYELLPLTADFRTALSRGMTPRQAYAHLALRELQLDASKMEDFPQEAIFREQDSDALREYTRRNAERFETYQKLTGRGLESTRGADGVTYWRARQADGAYTRWHEKPEHAVNDVVASASLSFMEYGSSLGRMMQEHAARQDFELLNWPPVQQERHTLYDRLCRAATFDMSRYWMGSVLRMQPGMEVRQVSRQFASTQGTDGVTPLMTPVREEGGAYHVNQYSVVTPLSVMQARFMTYWRRCLGSGSLDAAQVEQALRERGYLSQQDLEMMDAIRNRVVRLRRHQSVEDVRAARQELCNVTLARRLTDLSTHYVLAEGERIALPESAREWLSLAAFCPLEAQNSEYLRQGHTRFRMKVGDGMASLQRWANRRSMNKLREYADTLERFRTMAPLDERLQRHLDASVGLNEEVMLEQAWSLGKLSNPALCDSNQAYWDLLLEPAEAWGRLTEGQREALRRTMSAAAGRSGLPEVMEAQARQDGTDLVHELILNLDEVLREHPELHRYALRADDLGAIHEMHLGVARQEPQLSLPDPALERRHLRSREQYAVLPWDGKVQQDFVVGDMQPLPEFMRGDERVLTAMRTLDQLRSFVARQPYATEDGIWMNNRLYGGKRGARPASIPAEWVQDAPLSGVMSMLGRVDELIRAEGKESIRLCGVEMRPSEGLIDESPWRTVTVYRDPTQAEMVYRLMPGDAGAASGSMRSPYVVICWNGLYMKVQQREVVREPRDLAEAVNPLTDFHLFERRRYNMKRMEPWARKGIEYTLEGIAERAEMGARQPDAAFDLGYRELLMRLCEDTGFSWSVRRKEPGELDAGECLALGLARELLLCSSGSDADAPRRLHELVSRVREDPELYQTLVDTLMGSNSAFRLERLRRKGELERYSKRVTEQTMLEAVGDRLRRSRRQKSEAPAQESVELQDGE